VVDATATGCATTATRACGRFLWRDAEHRGRFGLGPVDGIGFARMNQPGYLMRIVPGPIRTKRR